VQGENKVEASSSPPPKEVKVCLNSILNEDEPIHVSYYASISDSDDDYDDIEDASISTNERMLKFELARANKLLNETNQALLRSEGTIEGLTKKVLELESKVTEYETKKIIFEKEQKDFIQQISNLKIEKQLLDLKNRALKSTSASSSGIRLDSTNLYKGQQSHDKTSLGYKKISPSLQSSKNPKSPKEKGKQIQIEKGMHGKTQNPRNAPYYAFRYNPAWSKNTYHRTPTGWRYEVKGKHVAQFGSQLDEKSRIISQQINSSNKDKISKLKAQAQRLKDDYHNRFVKVVVNPPTSVFCNYCCKYEYISLECKFRKGNNMSNVAWVPKIKK
jgi:beta-glucosidase-like glycosyl hydrolase